MKIKEYAKIWKTRFDLEIFEKNIPTLIITFVVVIFVVVGVAVVVVLTVEVIVAVVFPVGLCETEKKAHNINFE